MPADALSRLEIGHIVKAHGIRGEVVVVPITNRPERFESGAVHYAGERRMVVARGRLHHERWIVAYEGVEDRDAADDLRGAVLTGDPIDVLEGDEAWAHELIGATVIDAEGVERGTIVAVEVNPAHDLLVLDNDVLVPSVFVTDRMGDRVVVEPPPGLFEEE